uniref:Uncharacterized protein n=1 Tax=Manihot esculenta TaxID=3983 RepID=A0A2C9WCR3_MANES
MILTVSGSFGFNLLGVTICRSFRLYLSQSRLIEIAPNWHQVNSTQKFLRGYQRNRRKTNRVNHCNTKAKKL